MITDIVTSNNLISQNEITKSIISQSGLGVVLRQKGQRINVLLYHTCQLSSQLPKMRAVNRQIHHWTAENMYGNSLHHQPVRR